MTNKEGEVDLAKTFESIAIKHTADETEELANALESLDLPTLAQDAHEEALELYEKAKGNDDDDKDEE